MFSQVFSQGFSQGDLIMGLSTEEQETTINILRSEDGAEIYTSDTTMMTKLDKLCKTSPEFYRLESYVESYGKTVGKLYKVEDKKLISFRGKKRPGRSYTDEEKAEVAERFKKARRQKGE